MALNLIKVPYNSTSVAKFARSYRIEAKRVGMAMKGRNVAFILLVGGGHPIVMASEPPTSKKVPDRPTHLEPPRAEKMVGVKPQARHSEKALFQSLRATLEGGSRIQCVYTERQPCGKARGHANCSKLLEGILAAYGEKGGKTPVYFSFDYPTVADIEFLVRDPALKFSREEAVEMCRSVCLETSEQIIAMDRAF